MERLRWGSGSLDDVATMIAALHAQPDEWFNAVRSNFPTVEVFVSHVVRSQKAY